MLNELKQKSEEMRLTINKGKTNIIRRIQNDNQPEINITLGDVLLQHIVEYMYFGQTIRVNKASQTVDLKRRIRMTWSAFGKLSYTLRNKNGRLTVKSKVQLLKEYVIHVLTYAAETWALTSYCIHKIQMA